MKKNYNQSIVETTNIIVSSQALCTSPAPGTIPNSGEGTGSITTPPGGSIIGG